MSRSGSRHRRRSGSRSRSRYKGEKQVLSDFDYFYNTDDLLAHRANKRSRRSRQDNSPDSRRKSSLTYRNNRLDRDKRRALSNEDDARRADEARIRAYDRAGPRRRTREKSNQKDPKKKKDPALNEGVISKSDWIMPIKNKDEVKKKYKFKGKIGDGNFATVYKGEAQGNGKMVAIKVSVLVFSTTFCVILTR